MKPRHAAALVLLAMTFCSCRGIYDLRAVGEGRWILLNRHTGSMLLCDSSGCVSVKVPHPTPVASPTASGGMSVY